MKRKLAVPIALRNVEVLDRNRMVRERSLRQDRCDPEDYEILRKLAENRTRIERLERDMDFSPHAFGCDDIVNELEYLKAEIEVGILECATEIEDVPSSEDLLMQEAALA